MQHLTNAPMARGLPAQKLHSSGTALIPYGDIF
jgi:hypothetical protein